jgi:DNA polymerase III delta prime subunit
MQIEQTLWVEKYRPKKLSDLVLPESYQKDFKTYLGKKDIPNLLFHGPPGSGKSTLARIVTSSEGLMSLPDDNLLEINGSAKETRGIGFVQDVVEPFLKIPPLKDPFRIVYIDEADFMTEQAFHSLRGIIEKYSAKCRFIFTVNYFSKVPEAVQSRFTSYGFKQFPVESVLEYCKGILQKENIKFKEDDLRYVVDTFYPDIRRIVSTLQRCSLSGNLTLNRDIVQSVEKMIIALVFEIVDFLQQRQDSKLGQPVGKIVNALATNADLDYRRIYEELFYDNKVPVSAKILVNKYANGHGDCLMPSMHFMGLIFDIIKSLQEYKKLKG